MVSVHIYMMPPQCIVQTEAPCPALVRLWPFTYAELMETSHKHMCVLQWRGAVGKTCAVTHTIIRKLILMSGNIMMLCFKKKTMVCHKIGK